MPGTITPQAPPVALAVVLRLDEDGPEVTREPVTDADLLDAKSELWLAGLLRKGHPDVPMEDLHSRLVPLVRHESSKRCTGFALETTSPGGQETRCEFSIHAVEPAATRAGKRLLASGQMKAGDKYYYEVVPDPRPAVRVETVHDGMGTFTVVSKNPPLTYLEVPLRQLLKKATTIGELDERMCHVFYTQGALARAERCARKGGKREQPIETGAVLVGPLCSCPETGDFFVVVTEALEVQDAEETEFSLTYSGKSWARIQAVMKARQANPATRAHRIVGQCHGHNFLPAEGAPPCELCSKVKVCTRTSVFVSQDDRDWSRAVFSRQPWQLCHIFGLNARNEEVHSLYGLRDGRLAERGFHVIPDFRPEATA